MRKNNFNEWLEELVRKNNIDISETYIIKQDGKNHYLTIKQIMDCLNLLNEEEKENTKNAMEEVLEEGGTVKDYLLYLGLGCINTLNNSNSEENEEAM